MKRRKGNYCHQAFPQILGATLDFMKNQKQSQKSRNSDIKFKSVKLLQKLPIDLLNMVKMFVFPTLLFKS